MVINVYIGSHVSFTKDKQLVGSLKEALSYGANTFMFYTGAPQNTNRCDIDNKLTEEAFKMMKNNNIDSSKIIVHAPYIINLCNEEKFDFSCNFLIEEVKRVEKLGIKYLVLHPGSHVGLGVDKGIDNICKGLKKVFESTNTSVTILLETMAGKGTEIGRNIEEINEILTRVNSKHLGVCLDTCHLHDSGYDLTNFDEFLNQFDVLIGIDKIKCVHINDSKNTIGSHKDRHENIGFGNIGFDTLISIVYNDKLKDVPKILETPYVGDNPPYKYEIEMITNKRFDKNLINKIK
ncbi:MAG: deoxyribonuclease IV [Bacilli bacterium]|nr:deoxyribonuclease IV [Bacilli bacterium]